MSGSLKTTLPENFSIDAIRPVASIARLEEIQCRELNARLIGESLGSGPINPDVSFEATHRLVPHGLVVSVRVTLVGAETSEGREREIVRVDSSFELSYSVEGIEHIEEKSIRAFSHVNGLYNAWPYAREALQSSTVRLGLPPYTLELLKIPTKPS